MEYIYLLTIYLNNIIIMGQAITLCKNETSKKEESDIYLGKETQDIENANMKGKSGFMGELNDEKESI